MEIEFSQKIGQTTIRLKTTMLDKYDGIELDTWNQYQKASELWQQVCEYELSLLPESEQPGSSFKKLKR